MLTAGMSICIPLYKIVYWYFHKLELVVSYYLAISFLEIWIHTFMYKYMHKHTYVYIYIQGY